MTETVQFIVSNLNDFPFDMNLRLIDFDEKHRHELLQILIDVLVSIDSSKVLNSNDQNYYFHNDSDTSINEVLSLLSIIRYKNASSKEEGVEKEEGEIPFLYQQEWINHLRHGDKEVIYSILEFCFSNYDKVKKRAYLAPFLTPIQLPLDITMAQKDDTLINLSRQYQSLQEEFKEVHMLYEEAKKNDSGMGCIEMKKEIEKLKEEKIQLLNQLKIMRESNRSASGKDDKLFSKVLMATTAVRKEEEKEMLLQDRMKDQKDALNIGEAKLNQLQQQYQSLQSIAVANGVESVSPEVIMNEIKKQLAEVTVTIRSDLVSKRSELQQKIDDIERNDNKKCSTEEDLDYIREETKELEEEYKAKLKSLQKEKAKQSYTKIAIFKQHADVAERKLKAKESVLRMKTNELESLKVRVNSKKFNFVRTDQSIPNEKTKEDFIEAEFQEKVIEQKKLEEQVIKLQDESLTLQRTIDILTNRDKNIDNHISDQKGDDNVKGVDDAHKSLKDTIESIDKIDEMKGQTLQEISEMVTKITETLKLEKERLQPMIQELKKLREEYQKVEDIHLTIKKRYDKMFSRLAADRQQLEKECDIFQQEWQQQERNYHYLTNLNEITMANLEKVQMEEDWKNGVQKMLPDFKCLHDLYQNKLIQQENLAKQLRIEQRTLNENESEHLKQRQLFLSLKRAIELKVKLKKEENLMFKSNTSVTDQIRTIEGFGF